MLVDSTRDQCPENLVECRQRQGIPKWKRVLDVGLVLLFSPVLVVPVVLILCLIKVVSRGPAFFGQLRIGYLGMPFTCLKFRTMHATADQLEHERYTRTLISNANVPMQKLDLCGDPRVIRFGRILRASALDELPQLLNVLMGEMSLVGPRPCMPYEYAHYTKEQRRRCETSPGLTGLWQVSGKNHTTFDQMIALDIDYISRRSLRLDLLILAKTVPAVLAQLLELRTAKSNRKKNCSTRDDL